ncbi:MAG TPA: helix-turn-helix transcriptional regulator [Actinomycetes bacterium]|nr:helix-turn-helix transcriptional regulator [Actinomycetes bacterium]
MPTLRVDSIGDYIRDQRRNARISLRQLAILAGVSNPYLSQIERGLRHPSAEILQQIAKGLRISAESLYVRAGILEERSTSPEVTAAIHGDHGLTERQKRVLVDIYETFRRENAAVAEATATVAAAASTAADLVDSVGAGLSGSPAALKGSHNGTTRRESARAKGTTSRVPARSAPPSSASAGRRRQKAEASSTATAAPTSARRSHPKT